MAAAVLVAAQEGAVALVVVAVAQAGVVALQGGGKFTLYNPIFRFLPRRLGLTSAQRERCA